MNNLKVGFTNELSVQHHPVKLKKYSEKRNRNYTNVFMDKYAIDKIVANYDDNRGQVITLRENKKKKNWKLVWLFLFIMQWSIYQLVWKKF